MTRRSNGFAPTVALIALLSFLSACASEPARPTPGRASEDGPKLAAVANGSQVGVASWYGGKFHGRTTASGEPYDMHAMTAAHPSLPFGTKVRVTNLENGRSAVLRINDRGPFAKRRIIDVSRHAAEHLGFLKAGLAKVQVEVI
jgi:rare lipoprotein A